MAEAPPAERPRRSRVEICPSHGSGGGHSMSKSRRLGDAPSGLPRHSLSRSWRSSRVGGRPAGPTGERVRRVAVTGDRGGADPPALVRRGQPRSGGRQRRRRPTRVPTDLRRVVQRSRQRRRRRAQRRPASATRSVARPDDVGSRAAPGLRSGRRGRGHPDRALRHDSPRRRADDSSGDVRHRASPMGSRSATSSASTPSRESWPPNRPKSAASRSGRASAPTTRRRVSCCGARAASFSG